MSKTEMKHRGFTGSYDISFDDDCLHGRVLFIDDLISYEGATPAELKQAFIDAVDRYIAHCETTGKAPNKPYSGTFNVRVGAELHRSAARCARQRGMTLNELIVSALQASVDQAAAQELGSGPGCLLKADAAVQDGKRLS
jgi:predicted HicB family RNase H-like nuclease